MKIHFVFPDSTFMKKIFLLAFMAISVQFTFAQNFAWVQSWGGSAWDYSRTAAVDGEGNIFVSGYFRDAMDADPGPAVVNLVGAGERDVYVSKFNASGKLLWAKQFSGALDEAANSITTDAEGNVYITGTYIGTVDFDPGSGVFNLVNTTFANTFICKLDTNGDFVWAKAFNGGAPAAFAIAVDANQNVYTTGRFNALTDFDPGPGTYNLDAYDYSDMFVCRLNANGDFVWAKQVAENGDTASIKSISIAVDLQGNVITTGTFYGTVDFDPGSGTFNLVSAGEQSDVAFAQDVFISKLDSDGDFVWAGSIAGIVNEVYSTGIAVDQDDNMYISGYFFQTVDFDPGPGSFEITSAAAGVNSYVCKLDSYGGFVWAKAFLGTSAVLAQGIALDEDHVYTTGHFYGSVDFDPGAGLNFMSPVGGTDIFVSKLDLDGNYVWAQKAGGVSDESALSIALDPANGNVFVTGYFTDTTDFDPSVENWEVASHGEWDAFLVKFSACVPSIGMTETAEACNQYTWAENDGFYTSSGIYWNILTSASGCDSIVKLDLDLSHYDSQITFSGGYMSPVPNIFIDQFQWINCETFQVVGTTGSFHPTVTGSYALISFAGDCADTSNCISVDMGVGIDELESAGFLLYPNPVSDKLVFQSTNALQSFEIEITSVNGQLIYKGAHSGGDQLSVGEWQAGIYLVKVISGGNLYVTRILKE